jgi:hypothetical protein
MKTAALAALAVATACANDARGRMRPPDDRSVTAGDAARAWCWDSVEVRALTCSSQTARRVGETLYVRLTNGSEMSYVDVNAGENAGGYRYIGRIPRPSLHVVQSHGHETPPSWLFVDERTGRAVSVNDEPVLSPDSARFVTAAEPDWNNCSERGQPSLDVWRFTDTLPVLEWRLVSWDCRRLNGWGPTAPHWRGPDTLGFIRNEEIVRDTAATTRTIVGHLTSHGIAVRDQNSWRVIRK